jgi:hypothetical protein
MTRVSIKHGPFAGLVGQLAQPPLTKNRLEHVVVAIDREQCAARVGDLTWVLDKLGRVEVTVPVCNTVPA